MKYLLGGDIASWEAHTVLVELDRVAPPRIPEVNEHKVLMCLALDAGRTDVLADDFVFQKMALVLNNEIPHLDASEVCSPEQVAWAVVALGIFKPEQTLMFDYQVVAYIARCLAIHGYVIPPDGLTFVQPALSRLNENREIEPGVKEAWKTGKPTNDIEKVQVERLTEARDYVHLMYADLSRLWAPFKSSVSHPRETGT